MTKKTTKVALGIDFGTESVRALLVSLDGREVGTAVSRFRHGQILDHLPESDRSLPPDYALQAPDDWVTSSTRAVKQAMRQAQVSPANVVGIGVDFTSCTMLPTTSDGTPLCRLSKFAEHPLAWPKLWKHHGAHAATDRINEVARRRQEKFLARYGGSIGIEWFFPKMLETLEQAPAIYAATDVWLEAGDWFVWQLVGGTSDQLPRSTCQAGYKAIWSAPDGYPDTGFFKAVHPSLANVVAEKMPGKLYAPGQQAGTLSATAAKRLGLREGTPVSAA
ncbi:MAG: ribulokinase, partial [Planctomycetales bacterium]|nr:ribulokinase [Planctomycetales bacterium]